MAILFKVSSVEKKSFVVETGRMDKKDLKRLLGANIRRIRESKGLKSREFAERYGLDPTHLSRIENGRGASDETVADLCTKLRLPPSEFYRAIVSPCVVNEAEQSYGLPVAGLESIRVLDNAMLPRYEPGDMVFFDGQPPANGEYAVVKLSDGQLMVRRVTWHADIAVLEALAPGVPSMIIPRAEILSAKKILWTKEK
jgi:transcriptional regulator with XRE-family HTH domain